MTLAGSYKVASNAAIRAKCGKSDEMLLRGLQSTALPIGFTMSTVTVSSMGERIDLILPTGGSYEEISVNYNFVIGDPSQIYLMQCALNNTEIQDMRFYVDDDVLAGDFATVDLISDSGASYRVGTFSAPTGSKNELFTGTVAFLPAGASTLFTAHASGADLTFTTGAGATTATVTCITQDFVALGFVSGMTLIIDHMGASDPLFCKIDTVAAKTLTLVASVGNETSVTSTAGGATSAVHGGVPMIVT